MVESPTFANNKKPSNNGSRPESPPVMVHNPRSFTFGNTFLSLDQIANRVPDDIPGKVAQHKS